MINERTLFGLCALWIRLLVLLQHFWTLHYAESIHPAKSNVIYNFQLKTALPSSSKRTPAEIR
jgi:hypothetical protein